MLKQKRNVCRVLICKDNANYVAQLTKVDDKEEGLFIEGKL
jgi:hypothetical protein